eukprot:1673470-Alexandrium_andersonii.AAC.1
MGQVLAWGRRPRGHIGRTKWVGGRPGPEPKVGAVRRLGWLGPGCRRPEGLLRPGLGGFPNDQPSFG